MKLKSLRATVALKEDAPEGTVVSRIATLDAIDKDGDVTRPGAFKDSDPVHISPWNHASAFGQTLPVGTGQITEEGKEAIFEGLLNLGMEAGRETHAMLKHAAEQGVSVEWSYGFNILEAADVTEDGQKVRELRKLAPFEVSPVMMGAGIGTGTIGIKAGDGETEAKPFPNEHACRLEDPDKYSRFRRKNGDQTHDGKPIDVIYGRKKSDGKTEIQSLRYPVGDWSEGDAKDHCRSREGSFEAAEEKSFGSFETHFVTARAVVADVAERASSLAELRAKEGRALSATNRGRLTSLATEMRDALARLDDLLAATDPPEKNQAALDVAAFQVREARLRGIPVGA